ncbi:MAG: heme peroxidase family protein [Actinomycetota bacterium]|nr:heme peroxidase family protein [Actinomycetota bacterium]
MPQHHVSHPRGSDVAPKSVFIEGRFGRMFRNLPSFEPPDPALDELASTMQEASTPTQPADSWTPSREENSDGEIPAGFTYLGQFIDHDLTFDPVSSLQRQNDPDALHDFRTPRFDLDSLYGGGPNNDPFMYNPDIDEGRTTLLVGKVADTDPPEDDLPRNVVPPDGNGEPRGRALIGDPRNDENIIVSQLHLQFMKFHNKVVETVRGAQPGLSPDALFEEAQRITRWHYQWIVVNDFLRRLVGDEVVESILKHPKLDGEDDARKGGNYLVSPDGAVTRFPKLDLRFYRWHNQPFMPVEFSVAAYRFGHSMIRPTYKINDVVPELPIFSSNENPGRLEAFHGFRPLPPRWTIQWEFFFETGDGSKMQVVRKIDTNLALGIFHLPDKNVVMRNLAARNLKRGRALGLPSGQRIAHAMGIDPLTDEQLGITQTNAVFEGNAPLWFYVLKEADVCAGGKKLGPVGGRIVTEVLLGLLKGDSSSFINVHPNWTPTLGDGSDFKMADLIKFVAS